MNKLIAASALLLVLASAGASAAPIADCSFVITPNPANIDDGTTDRTPTHRMIYVEKDGAVLRQQNVGLAVNVPCLNVMEGSDSGSFSAYATAVNSAGESAPTSPVNFVIDTQVAIPHAPSNIEVTF